MGTPLASPAPNTVRMAAGSYIEGFAKDINLGGQTLSGFYDGSNGVAIQQSPHMQIFGSQRAFSVSPLVSGLTFEQVKKVRCFLAKGSHFELVCKR